MSSSKHSFLRDADTWVGVDVDIDDVDIRVVEVEECGFLDTFYIIYR